MSTKSCSRCTTPKAITAPTKATAGLSRFGELVPVDAVTQMEAEIVAAMRDNMDGLSAWLKARVPANNVFAVDRVVRELEAQFMAMIERGRASYPPIKLN
jgi:hypothetical protein